MSAHNSKIKTRDEISHIVKLLREKNPSIKIVTTNGAFDIMHAGHVHSLRQAKSYGDILIVGLNSDASIRRYKSIKRPIIPEKDRATMMEALEFVDYVVIFEEDTSVNLINAIKPNFHIKSKNSYNGTDREPVEKNGGKLILVDDIPGISTSEIVRKIIDAYEFEKK